MIDDVKMKRGEVFHGLRVPDGMWAILRVDGRSFHTHVKEMDYERPYDDRFHSRMTTVADALVKEFNGRIAYTQSDECSVVIPPNFDMFDREVEKLVSVSASLATLAYNSPSKEGDGNVLTLDDGGTFDSRVCVGTRDYVEEYLLWRRADAWRNCVSAWAYWEARRMGMNGHTAHAFAGRNHSEKHEFLTMERGINPADLPLWQKNGTMVFWEEYEKEGYDPIKECGVVATRRRIREEGVPSSAEDYLRVLGKILA